MIFKWCHYTKYFKTKQFKRLQYKFCNRAEGTNNFL